jgi:hypothetical protein
MTFLVLLDQRCSVDSPVRNDEILPVAYENLVMDFA